MIFKELKDRSLFDLFWSGKNRSNFLCSWEWFSFQSSLGNDIFAFAILDDSESEILAIGNVVKKKILKHWNYIYCFGGPEFADSKDCHSVLLFSLDEMRKNGLIDKKTLFFRIETRIDFEMPNLIKTIDLDPLRTWILNLNRTEEDILAGMKQKTRYNINLAIKKGVKVFEAGINDFDCFWRMAKQTSTRDGFRLHGRNYYKKMLEDDSGFFRMFLAKDGDECLAGVIAVFYNDTTTYLHGVSGNSGRNKMAPVLLQWFCIKKAKEVGKAYYDFFGIDEVKWPGVTRFKKSFPGEEIATAGTKDFVFSRPRYYIYNILRKIRRKVRFF